MASPTSAISTDNVAKQKKLKGKSMVFRKFKAQGFLQCFAIMGVIYLLIFNYLPMFGIIIGFKDYKLATGVKGFFTSRWVGLRWFKEFFNDIVFWPVIRNTLTLSFWKLIFTFPLPIILALALNEVRNQKVKKVVQTVSYLPHFISWVVVSGMIFSFANIQDGLINQARVYFGAKPISILSDPQYFVPMCVISDAWKEMGWWTIIFLAAIAGIDQSIYEAAIVDGAGRLRRMWSITLPCIKDTIVIVLILSLGNLLGGGLGGSNFEQSLLLGNQVNNSVSQILQTYTFKMGLAQGRFSYATAIGLFESVISLLLVFITNTIAKKVTGTGLY